MLVMELQARPSRRSPLSSRTPPHACTTPSLSQRQTGSCRTDFHRIHRQRPMSQSREPTCPFDRLSPAQDHPPSTLGVAHRATRSPTISMPVGDHVQLLGQEFGFWEQKPRKSCLIGSRTGPFLRQLSDRPSTSADRLLVRRPRVSPYYPLDA